MTNALLTINGGSSSVKFALYEFENSHEPRRLLVGQTERVGTPEARLHATDAGGAKVDDRAIPAQDHRAGAVALITWLRERAASQDRRVVGVGHRVVHGGINLLDHRLIDDELVAELHRAEPLDLAHLPREIALIELFRAGFTDAKQVACFDTAFHRDLPRVAQLLPIPRKFTDRGVRRFGFHGLSYTYLMEALRRVAGDEAANGRVILAHLGSGASMAAVRSGKPIETTMAFTPLAGLVMGTRPGDLDPGLLVYLMREEKLSFEQMDDLLSHRCGMMGVSDTGADLRDLTGLRDAGDVRAKEAIQLFCYSARKWIGALAGALGGLDTLVFSGGIGEHSVEARAEICRGLEFLGVQIDDGRNRRSEPLIGADGARVAVRVIATDEERVIARIVARFCNAQGGST